MTETQGIFKAREADFKRNDESSTAGLMSTVVDQQSGLLRSRRHLSAPEKRNNSLWAYISIILCFIRMKTLPFINVRNRFVGLSFPIFKMTKLSDASSQTDPPRTRETCIAFTQTVTSTYANASMQTVTSATKTVAAQTVTSATNTVAAQTDATHCHVVAVQTDATQCHATSVQTDALSYSAAAVQTDAQPCTTSATVQTDSTTVYDTVAVPARAYPAFCGTVARRQMNDPNNVRLTYNTFSQTDSAAFCETVAAQTDSAAFRETVAAQTDSSAFCETVAAQTDSAAFCETVAAQTDSTAFCHATAVQTDAVVCEAVACQTDSPPSACGTIAVRTGSAPREDDGDNEKRSSAAATAVQEADLTTDGTAVSVGVQTDEPVCATVQNPKKDSNKDVIDELSEKFGRGDHKNAAINNKPVNLKSVLKKIELNGFKSLSFKELSFTHQKIIDNSVALCKKYQSLIEIAVKHLPSWQRGSIKQKHDIIHIFATLDKVLDLKNQEVETHKIDLASEIKKRTDVEKQYAIKDKLLSQTKMNYERQVAKNNTSLQPGNSKSNRNSDVDKFVQQCSNSRFTYGEIISGKFLKRPRITKI